MIAGSNIELTLRRLQQIDEAVGLGPARKWLTEAQDALGAELGLECTGVVSFTFPSGAREYEHNGDTCPIHEWLDPGDQPEAEQMRERVAV